MEQQAAQPNQIKQSQDATGTIVDIGYENFEDISFDFDVMVRKG